MPSFSLKPPLTFDEQLDRLIERGLIIENHEKDAAIAMLQRFNYYRLYGYLLKRKDDNGGYVGQTFEQLKRLNSFDLQMEITLLDPLRSIELRLRTWFAYRFSLECGSEGLYNKSNFKDGAYYDIFIRKFQDLARKNSDNLFIRHHNKKYEGMTPPWVAVEIMTFSMLSKLYANVHDSLLDKIIKDMEFPWSGAVLKNWLHALSSLRNICAHYGRLYNRDLVPPITLPKGLFKQYPEVKFKRVLSVIYPMCKLLGSNSQRHEFISELRSLLEAHQDEIDYKPIGLPRNWNVLLDAWYQRV